MLALEAFLAGNVDKLPRNQFFNQLFWQGWGSHRLVLSPGLSKCHKNAVRSENKQMQRTNHLSFSSLLETFSKSFHECWYASLRLIFFMRPFSPLISLYAATLNSALVHMMMGCFQSWFHSSKNCLRFCHHFFSYLLLLFQTALSF